MEEFEKAFLEATTKGSPDITAHGAAVAVVDKNGPPQWFFTHRASV